MPPLRSHTVALTTGQATTLRGILEEQNFKFEPRPYTLYFAQKPGLTVAVYEKGPKAVVQGKETKEFVEFTLEPAVLGEARLAFLLIAIYAGLRAAAWLRGRWFGF